MEIIAALFGLTIGILVLYVVRITYIKQEKLLQDMQQQARLEFENLAQHILDSKAKTFGEQTEKSLGLLLLPLREKITTFEKTIDEKYSYEAKERHALKSEIERLVGLNQRMSQETQMLTQALKGDSKVMGDWGEAVLIRILEASGLRLGHEYTMQTSYTNDDGDHLRPDVTIVLPDHKHLVVDSKVSLKAYAQYQQATDATHKAALLAAHIKSMLLHIDDLSQKHYSKLQGLHAPEIVFLFVPVEPAYLLAMQSSPDLMELAWKKRVAMVTATTLLASLKTVASIWRLEHQNKNAKEIAKEGAKLYDKFVGFLEDFEKMGKIFDAGQAQYHTAMGKLKEGPGNVFRRIERLRALGAAPEKHIRPELLE